MPRQPAPTAQRAEPAGLRRRLRTANGRITALEGQPDDLATVTAHLYREDPALKQKPGRHSRLTRVPRAEPRA
ncbi:hypothetical protein [Streptomyces sp. NBC_00316]|uniref:hypothetical protein n=1 Tax=Streptomyces sp. NBC_00316 TaxID=2975710 RepID=UPI002E27B406|nr:hypothetical protein [Streptomyces sp. NBC_00316]